MLIRNRGEKVWHEPETARYASEADLENLVKESPDVIPGVPSGPVAIVTQLQVPDVGPADVVVIDVEGGITVIECKLQENPEIRRWVIGQVFSYAAGIAGMAVEELNDRWRARTGGLGIVESFSAPLPDGVESAELLARISENLQAGRLRLVIAVDAMTDELKRTVSFINSRSGGVFELLGLELDYVSDSGVEILVPRVFGEETAARKASSARTSAPERPTAWTPPEMVERFAQRSPRQAEAVTRIFAWAEDRGDLTFEGNKGLSIPRIAVRLAAPGGQVTICAVWGQNASAEPLDIQFSSIRGRAPFDQAPARERLWSDLGSVVHVSGDPYDSNPKAVRANVDPATLNDADLRRLFAILDDVGDRLKAAAAVIPERDD